MRCDITERRTMRQELDMQKSFYGGETRGAWQKPPLRYAVAGLPEEEPSQNAKYVIIFWGFSAKANHILRLQKLLSMPMPHYSLTMTLTQH